MKCCRGLVTPSAATQRLSCSCFSKIGRYEMQRRPWFPLGLPGPPFQVDLQLLQLQQAPASWSALTMQTSDFQKLDVGICGQRGAGKASFLNQYCGSPFPCRAPFHRRGSESSGREGAVHKLVRNTHCCRRSIMSTNRSFIMFPDICLTIHIAKIDRRILWFP